jgi:hypothetical protein
MPATNSAKSLRVEVLQQPAADLTPPLLALTITICTADCLQAQDTIERSRSSAQDVYESAKDTAHRTVVKPVGCAGVRGPCLHHGKWLLW